MSKKLEAFFKRMSVENQEVADLVGQFRDTGLIFESIPPMSGSVALPEPDAIMFGRGKAFFPLDDWKLEELQLDSAALYAVQELKKVFEDQADELDKLAKAIKKEPELVPELTGLMLEGDVDKISKFASKAKVEEDLVLYVLQNVFQKRASEIAQQAAPLLAKLLEDAKWQQGYCPVCGAAANISFLQGEGGSRHLCCSLCRQQWRYARNACPYCATDKPENITVYYAEEKSGHRAEVCSACKRYILSADLRKKSDDVPFAHYLAFAMIPLDMLMSDKGFAPGVEG